MLYVALMLMTAILFAFALAWYLSPSLREGFEEPKYKILEDSIDKSDQ